MLKFYWSLGRDLVTLKAEQKWGTGVVKQLSLDLRAAFPDVGRLSADNLYFMRRWYTFYKDYLSDRNQKFDQVGQIIELPEKFSFIPWRHHVELIKKCHSVSEALFYINQIIDGNWSRRQLEDYLDSNLYDRHGKAVTNFEETLSVPQQKLAQELLKDPYNFDFLTMKLGYDEHELEEALVHNITHFLLELGQGFAFVGRQMELQMPGGQTFFPDLVFYHIRQKRYVVVELKVVKFEPEFAGKLNFYVTAADRLLKGADDNPSVGLLICKSHDKTLVEWSLQDINKPLGVASYQLQEVVDRTILEIENRGKGDTQ